jgi:hypothetical protein
MLAAGAVFGVGATLLIVAAIRRRGSALSAFQISAHDRH